MTDEEIVRLVQLGEKEKYGEIVERYERQLLTYVRRLINQREEEVEDLVQDVFISAYVNIQGFDHKLKFSSWIYRIAHNKAIDYFKKKRIKNMVVIDEDNEEWLVKEEKLQEVLAIEEESREKLKGMIEKLNVAYKDVIMLYFFENKSYEEISDILKIPTGNVGVNLMRAKKQLKKLLISNVK